ncbi:MAG: hypothetical protein SFU53_08105 [Terrimicrobiaceae bacterium]|nr:hypothetical protein [Terrimicrobiaceae bacterium]
MNPQLRSAANPPPSGPGIRDFLYAITREWSCSVYYNYAFRGSVSNISGFDRNVVGVAVTWQF